MEEIEKIMDNVVKSANTLESFIDDVKQEFAQNGFSFEGFKINENEIRIGFKTSKQIIVGRARCHPNDNFVVDVGRALSAKRALETLQGNK